MLIFHKVVGEAFKDFKQDGDGFVILALAERFTNRLLVRCKQSCNGITIVIKVTTC